MLLHKVAGVEDAIYVLNIAENLLSLASYFIFNCLIDYGNDMGGNVVA